MFAVYPSDLGTIDKISHSIETGDQIPVWQPPRRVLFALRDEMNGVVQDMLDRGIIEPSTVAYPGFEVKGVLKCKIKPHPLIYSKVRSSPVVARWAELRCEASHSFLFN